VSTGTSARAQTPSFAERVAAVDWRRVERELDADGAALVQALFTAEECRQLSSFYAKDELFRSQVVMERHGFGRGEYKYFSYPLPSPVAELRGLLYAELAPVANAWNERLAIEMRYPADHSSFVQLCHAAGQTRPTPLLLRYGAGDYNCLHQDLYGEQMFPLQVAVLLSDPERDFSGGEFVMTEQRPRRQSRPLVLPLRLGDALVFAVNERPVQGTRGVYRVKMRHGVSRLRGGERHTLGIIFHDAS
jgi:uncharacterized protein